jgi:hypothetical protein
MGRRAVFYNAGVWVEIKFHMVSVLLSSDAIVRAGLLTSKGLDCQTHLVVRPDSNMDTLVSSVAS